MPSAAGPETERRTGAPRPWFSFGPFAYGNLAPALASAPRNVEPQGVRRARGRSGGNAIAPPNGPKEKIQGPTGHQGATSCRQNIIRTNDTDQIDAIIDDWKQEAAHLATAMAENPKETMADATYGVDVILEKAWKYVVGECELPVPQRLVEAIESIDEYDANVRIAADDLNTEYRADERDNLRHLELAHPVIILGKAGLWNGSRTIASVVRFDNIGDIISDSPWTGMEYETWKIDGHDDRQTSASTTTGSTPAPSAS